jgi:hypothetical protein
MKFKYKNFGGNWKPVVPVILSCGGKEMEYWVLLDSGADMCIGHAEIGKAIGLKITSGEKYEFGGITGPGVAYKHFVDIKIGGHLISNVEFSFSPDIPIQCGFGVLGHRGFFEYFKVTFETPKRLVEIRPIELVAKKG